MGKSTVKKLTTAVFSIMLSLAMLFGMCGMNIVSAETNSKISAEENQSNGSSKWQISKSKKVTSTGIGCGDGKDEKYPNKSTSATVTLSLPSAEEELATDVVFVMDSSSCAPESLQQVFSMLSDLNSSFSRSNAKINVGVITFAGIALNAYDLTEYHGDNQSIEDKINDSLAQHVLRGSNIPAGLDAAKIMLDNSSTPSWRKYMILVSDGGTYLYTHGKQDEHYSRTTGVQNMDGSLYEWQAKYGAESALPTTFVNGGDTAEWSAFLDTINVNRSSYDYSQYDQVYTRHHGEPSAGLVAPDPVITDPNFNINVEESFLQSYEKFSAMASKESGGSGYNCYSVSTKPNWGVFSSFMNYLGSVGNGAGANFDDIKKDIQYLLTSGTVTDTIGDEFTLDSDGTKSPFTITRGGTAVESVSTGTNEWSFDSADSNGVYPYVVDYLPDTKQIVWHINVHVENAYQLQLSYNLFIPDTTQIDKKQVTAHETNASATLEYVDNNGNTNSEDFENPTVEFDPTGCPVPTPVPTPTVAPTSTPTSAPAATAVPEDKGDLWCVTFLDCKGNTVSVQWVKTGESAVVPTGFGNYSGYANVTSHRDLRPNACTASGKWVVPNTAVRS